MVFDLDMFSFRVHYRILRDTYSASVITVDSDWMIIFCKSSRVCFIQITGVQQDATKMYYAYVVDIYIDVCFLLIHATNHFPR
jgi:hypothetical protein